MPSPTLTEKFAHQTIENRPLVNGRYITPVGLGVIAKTCPATGQRITPLHACSSEDIDDAVGHAEAAFRSGIWANKSTDDKKLVMQELARLMESELEWLAYLDTLETGRPYSNFTQDSIPKAIAALRWFTESIDKLYDHYASCSPNELSFVAHEPLGVVGIITPWNDPLVIALWKITPALLMGNSVVLKPAEQSSFSTIRLAALAQRAGLPDGVLNVVTGRGEEAGKALALHPRVRGIFFTGSSEVGKKILCYAGESNMKKVGLECGGKSAFIVSEQCDRLDVAAQTLASSMFYNQGQICSAPSRLFLQASVKERFLELLTQELAKYAPGNPFEAETRVGSVVSQEQFERIQRYIQIGFDSGLKSITVLLDDALPQEGYFVAPTVFLDVPPDSPLARDEIFGPVLVVQSFEQISEAVELANDSRYGLAASIWTASLDEALLCARALEAGIVHVNSYGEDDNSAPFGGIKESGLGKDKSIFAFDEYSTLKTTWIKLDSQRGLRK